MGTPSKRLQGQLRKERSRSGAAKTFAEAFVRGLKAVHALSTGGTYVWPAPEFYDDPEGFCSKALGVQLWGKQIEIALSLCKGTRVAVRSGRKVGKTALAACLALWFFCTRADAQVLLSASTMKQVERVIWRELRMRYERALHPLGGEINLSPLSGLKDGFRSIVGFSNRNREAAAGVSGVALLYVIDEASGVEDSIFSSIDGNLAGGADCKILLLSNPTRNEGYFADIFLNKRTAALWVSFTISSKDSPNCVAGTVVVPGLATLEWVDWQMQRYGEDSAEFIVHVLGEHALGEDGRAIPLSMVSAAIARHDPLDYDHGPTLYVGLDPAGDTLKGDLTSITARRGFHMLHLQVARGLTDDGVVALVAQVVDQFRRPDEKVQVNYDEGGEVGAKLGPKLRESATKNGWKLNRFRSSDKSVRFKANTERKSAELVWNFREWLRQGGAIIEDDNLTQEIRAWEFQRVKPDSEKVKVNKDAVRKLIKRSPDRFDSLALAVWDSWEDVNVDHPKPPAREKRAVNPYASKERTQRSQLSPFKSRH